ncbi:prepilin peptidase [Candidatus Roizmanbacteria bacterium]|nr:prepilin peptidase [Candidatus Roizmanbacteria bacterium]
MFFILIFMLGLAIGSFLNVLIDRLPQEESIIGRSHCDHCKKDLAWNDLMPILSYVYLGARCRYCGKKLSFVYPLVEIITAALFVFVVSLPSLNLRGSPASLLNLGGSSAVEGALLSIHVFVLEKLALLGIVSMAIVIFFSDLKYQIIPDSIQLSLFAFSFLFLITKGVTPQVFLAQVVAAFAVMLPILIIFLVTRGKGMGFGDVKFAFSLGFLLGIVDGVLALYTGFITGALVGIGLIFLRKKGLKSKIAFGPFLVLGLLTMLFFKNNIVQLLKHFYRF